ncbi:lysozyme inhibitor LprI family protein [Aestuariivirga litoralis]|uniref:lysozyme inhibitor LprI family protein n=1 Tax=Aestuariivirga litoralis TaxID=2650924 RepID=UPI0018C45C41|nr:hypothetical protein [Aestuariivirga litoralis]MBG1233598.1 hypothetical protein [Aestuariivirga litoralis]
MLTRLRSQTLPFLVVLFLSGIGFATAYADGPSFNCKKASSPDERAICADETLSELDVIIADGYKRMVDKVGKDQANAVNSNFFQARKGCGARVSCIGANGLAEIPAIHAIDDSFPTKDQQQTLDAVSYDIVKAETRIGDCVKSEIIELGPRLCTPDASGDCPENLPFDESGNTVTAKDHVYGVGYERDKNLEASRLGDPVQICLTSKPKHCPKGDDRGYMWKWKNLRTGKSWELPDSEHQCGGA